MDLSSVVSLRSEIVGSTGNSLCKKTAAVKFQEARKITTGKTTIRKQQQHHHQQQQQQLIEQPRSANLAPFSGESVAFRLARSPLIGGGSTQRTQTTSPTRYYSDENSSCREEDPSLLLTTSSSAASLSFAAVAAAAAEDTMLQPQVFTGRHKPQRRQASHRRQQLSQVARRGPLIWPNQRLPIALRGRQQQQQQLLLILSLSLFTISALCWWPSVVSAIKLQPEGRDKFYWTGDDFVVTCQNNNNIKNVKIRWIGPNGQDIPENRSQRVHSESTGPHGHRLVVQNASSPADEGQYKCTLGSTDDRNPREHLEFKLNLYRTTSFRDTPRHLVLAATGQQASLTCKVEFDPNIQSSTVSWSRDQQPIEMFNDTSYTVLDYDPARQVSQLLIAPLTRHQAGTYTCRAVVVTQQLSKISDHDIKLEVNYAPVFEQSSQVVWVERSQSAMNRHLQQVATNVYSANKANQQQQQQQPVGAAGASSGSRMRFSHIKQHHRRPNTDGATEYEQAQQQQQAQQQVQVSSNGSTQVVRVELHCSCQANPPASILWTTTRSNFVLIKGNPEHIVEEPTVTYNEHNTSSILVVSYNLSADWPYRREAYICSASNKIGRATKSFEVEQGDPPPAFNVGPFRQYNPQNYLFKFTLLGPNFDPDSPAQAAAQPAPEQFGASQRDIVPPVDSFRIRAETPQAAQAVAELKSAGNYWPNTNTRRLAELTSVQFNLNQPIATSSHHDQQQQHQQHQQQHNKLIEGQNMTVNLGRLPSGPQRLYLEAHNAVGWSPNATYLGDFYIVSGASSLLSVASGANLQTSVLITCYFTLLMALRAYATTRWI